MTTYEEVQLQLVLIIYLWSHNASKLFQLVVIHCSTPTDIDAHHAKIMSTLIKLVTENGSVIHWSNKPLKDVTIYRLFLSDGYQSPVYTWRARSWYSFLIPLLPGIHKLRLDGYIGNVGDTLAIDDIRVEKCQVIGKFINIYLFYLFIYCHLYRA